MANVDQRRLRVGVEVSGQMREYEGLAITAQVNKGATDTENTAEITLTNLSRDVRNFLLTETSPFNKNRTPKRVYVDAGRVSSGLSRVFIGDVVSASPTQPPDIGLTLSAQTGHYAKGDLVARTGAAKEPLSAIARRVADDLGVRLVFEAQDKLIANWSFSGALPRQIRALGAAGAVDAFHDDAALVVKDRGAPLRNIEKLVDATSGMVGLPEATERGVRVKMLFDPEVKLGGLIRVTSELNPALNGGYTVYSLRYDLASRAAPWYVEAEASRNT